jgi:molybdopterin-guanine dinucleotide biosynthesis protein MobB
MTDTPTTVPVVSIVGKGGSGKTTLLEKLIGELTARGVRVATVKHHAHDLAVDVPGKDSWRHAQAGSVAAMVSSPGEFSLVEKVKRELTLPEIAHVAADASCDVLLTEGFKSVATVRIEIARRARSEELICSADELVGVVTDMPDIVPDGVPSFTLDDASGVADLIQERFLGGGGR